MADTARITPDLLAAAAARSQKMAAGITPTSYTVPPPTSSGGIRTPAYADTGRAAGYELGFPAKEGAYGPTTDYVAGFKNLATVLGFPGKEAVARPAAAPAAPAPVATPSVRPPAVVTSPAPRKAQGMPRQAAAPIKLPAIPAVPKSLTAPALDLSAGLPTGMSAAVEHPAPVDANGGPAGNRGYAEIGGVRQYLSAAPMAETPGVSQVLSPLAPPSTVLQMTTVGNGSGVYQLAPGQTAPLDMSSASLGDIMGATLNSKLGLRAAQAQSYNTESAARMAKLPVDIEGTQAETRFRNVNSDKIELMTPVEYTAGLAGIRNLDARTGKELEETTTERVMREPKVAGIRAATAKNIFDVEEGRALLPGKKGLQTAQIANLGSETGLHTAQAAGLPNKAEIAAAKNEEALQAKGADVFKTVYASTSDAGKATEAQDLVVAKAKGAVVVPGLPEEKNDAMLKGLRGLPKTYAAVPPIVFPKGTKVPAAVLTEYQTLLKKHPEKRAALRQKLIDTYGGE